ncbi:MAG: hypothetical protein U0527_14060 [Candidatus Eisenbacteria bacterium]
MIRARPRKRGRRTRRSSCRSPRPISSSSRPTRGRRCCRGAGLQLGSGGSEAEAGASPEEDGAGRPRVEFHAQPPANVRNLEQTHAYLIELLDTLPEIHVLCDSETTRDRLADLMKMETVQFHVGNRHRLPRHAARRAGGADRSRDLRAHDCAAAPLRAASLAASRWKELLALTPGDFVVHVEHGSASIAA